MRNSRFKLVRSTLSRKLTSISAACLAMLSIQLSLGGETDRVTRREKTPIGQQIREFSGVALESAHRLDFERWRGAYEFRADPVDGIPPGAYLRAYNQVQASKAGRRPLYATESEQFWASIGPTPLLDGGYPSENASGRIVAVAADPNDTNHWFIGAAGGGIWETADAGITWIPKTDDQPSLQMNVLSVAPSNPLMLYGGTGNYGAYAAAGIGILRSTNGGLSWTFVTPSAFTNVDYFSFADLIVSPSNTAVLLTASSDFFGPTPSSGIFKSTDAGATWSRRLGGVGSALTANPTNFGLQFAAVCTIYGADDPTNGIYRSIDAGDTWQSVSGPWGVVPNAANPILITLAPSNPNTVYVSIFRQSLWRSTNAWAPTPIWTSLPLPQYPDTTFPGFVRMIADTSDPNVLYAGDVNLWKLTCTNWSNITGTTHVDQHAMAWAGNKLLVGNDGGLWSSVNGGTNWSPHNSKLGTIQFYRGCLHPTNPNFALGGTQDNGEEKWLGDSTWQFFFGGDEFSSAIANAQPDLRWAISFYSLSILRTFDGGTNLAAADGGIESANRPFYTLFAKSPVSDDTFITATHKLWKTTNFFSGATVSWSANGPDIGTAVTAMGFSPSDLSGSTYAYGGANSNFFGPNATVLLTTNAGATWVDINAGNQVPNRSVTGLAFAQSSANVLYLTLSGFNSSGAAGHVFKTTNALSGNPVWRDVSPPADLPYNAVVTDGSNGEAVFVGTDIGIWRSGDGGGSWTHMGPEVGMPNVVVNDLQLNPNTARLVAFTYGRGAFALVNATNVTDLAFTAEAISGSDVLLTFKTVLGHSYVVEATTNLPPSWLTVVSNVVGTGNPVTVRDPGGADRLRRFYRAAVSP